jgi:hypothetical protein
MNRMEQSVTQTLWIRGGRWFVLSTLILTAGGLLTGRVLANDSCRHVHGQIKSLFTTENCTSPVGLCTVGAITEAGELNGSTSFTAPAVVPSASLSNEPSANLSYSGQLTIVTDHGTLITNDLGVLDAAHLVFTEMESPASGTGRFENPGNAVFFISGAIVDAGQGFQGRLSDTLCAAGQD